MALYREDIVDIELESGSLHRSWMNHAIGLGDVKANRFGVRLFRNGEAVNIGSGTCQGFFMRPDGTNLQIQGSTYTGVDGNLAWVQLPQDAYAYQGQFCLAIKLIGGGITGTMRIIDGMVDNTGTTGAVSPTSTVPTSAEIIAAYNNAVAVIDNSVRFDITQSLTDTQKSKARTNIGAASQADLDAEATARANADTESKSALESELSGIYNGKIREVWENNRTYQNAQTDGRTNFQIAILEMNGSSVVSTLLNKNILETGKQVIYFTTDNSTFNKIRVKHNGRNTDLVIGDITNSDINTTFMLSFNVTGNNPTTVNGLSITDIILNEGQKCSLSTLNEQVQSVLNCDAYIQKKLVLGNFSVDASTGWAYTSSNKYAITPEGTTVTLAEGDIISLSDYTDAKFLVSWKKANNTYDVTPWVASGDYKITESGEYAIKITTKSDTAQSSADALAGLLQITKFFHATEYASRKETSDMINYKVDPEFAKPRYFTNLVNNTNILDGYKINISALKFGIDSDSTRCVLGKAYRVHPEDIINVKLLNEYWRVVLYKCGTDLQLISGTAITTQWINYVEENTIQGFDGYILVQYRLPDDSAISSWTGADVRDSVAITIFSNYEDKTYDTTITVGKAIQGNNISVSEVSHSSYFHTGFIPVKEGDVFYFTGKLTGILTSSNIRGIAGFSSQSLDSFVKWLFNRQIYDPTITTDGNSYIYNARVIVPKNVNYIVVDYMNSRDSTMETSGIYNFAARPGSTDEKLQACIEEGSGSSPSPTPTPSTETYIKMCVCDSEKIGDCLLFVMPNGKTLMVDTGEYSGNSAGEARPSILNSLDALEITHIDYFVVTHYHPDHVNNLEWLIETVGVIDGDTIAYTPTIPPSEYVELHSGDISQSNITTTVNLLEGIGIVPIHPTEGQKIIIGEVTLEFWNTDHSAYYNNNLQYNNASLCNFITFGNMVIALTGDMIPTNYMAYNQNHNLRKCNIYKASHHGGHTSLDNMFMQWIMPDVVVTPLGEYFATTDCSGVESAENVFIKNTTDSVQIWCEEHSVPNYVVGANRKAVFLDVSKNSFRIANSVKATDRYVEGYLTRS